MFLNCRSYQPTAVYAHCQSNTPPVSYKERWLITDNRGFERLSRTYDRLFRAFTSLTLCRYSVMRPSAMSFHKTSPTIGTATTLVFGEVSWSAGRLWI